MEDVSKGREGGREVASIFTSPTLAGHGTQRS